MPLNNDIAASFIFRRFFLSVFPAILTYMSVMAYWMNSMIFITHINSCNSSYKMNQFSMILRFPSNKHFMNHVIACVFNALLTLSTLCVTILTFWKTSQLRRNLSNVLISWFNHVLNLESVLLAVHYLI